MKVSRVAEEEGNQLIDSNRRTKFIIQIFVSSGTCGVVQWALVGKFHDAISGVLECLLHADRTDGLAVLQLTASHTLSTFLYI